MNKNVRNYKKAVDQIHVDPNLKDKVLEETKAKNKAKNSISYLRFAVGIAAVALVAVIGVSFFNKPKEEILKPNNLQITEEKTEALAKVDIKRFESIDELKEVLAENEMTVVTKGYNKRIAQGEEESVGTYGTNSTDSAISEENTVSDYSRTNNQVESVDEADIVKTDGKYIYYSQNSRVYIVDTDLNLKATIKEENYRPYQIFVNKDKLVVFGNLFQNNIEIYNTRTEDTLEENSVVSEDVAFVYRPKTVVKVYDLSNIENPVVSREIKVDGNYQDARMIEDNIYLVTQYYTYFYRGIDELKDTDILPCFEDSIIKENKYIQATEIAYFDHNTRDYSYSLITGFNLNSNEEANVETFFGAGNNMYVSENNMYIVTPNYSKDSWVAKDSSIYKFKLENANVMAVASGIVEGYVGSQFAIDEYEGNLRVATTSYDSNNIELRINESNDEEEKTKTQLTILNENLEKIGGIDNLIENEKIYAVRFIGKVGYIVTFQEIDPLWVIDLSDPTNPVVKGELEIPGYSSYLHPYDETHIFGIGYNVKDNGHGGVSNDTLKISMFDVSDVENPKEIFSKTFESKNAYSNIIHEHKALLFNKSENLIGFPVNTWERRVNKSGLLLYKIDMDNQKFEEFDNLIETTKYSSISRAVWVGDNIYTLYMDRILKYNIKTLEKIGTLELEYGYEGYYHW